MLHPHHLPPTAAGTATCSRVATVPSLCNWNSQGRHYPHVVMSAANRSTNQGTSSPATGYPALRATPTDAAVAPVQNEAAVFKTLGSLEDPLMVSDSLLESVDVDVEPSSQAEGAATTSLEENPYTEADAAVSPPLPEGLGEKELEALLAEGGKDLSADRVCKVLPYPLDNFQKKALEKFLEGQSVVVCAPTGAGKTAIAEAATAAVLAKGQRVIYTTPLKALSNQKLFEMRRRFGHVRCGLQTGDTSLNTEAQVVIMTTEILRNIMYRVAEKDESEEGEMGGSMDGIVDLDELGEGEEGVGNGWMTREKRLADVGLVVMDEVHYLADPFRGSVWEEAIINCPRHIQLLCMSATVRNPDDLGAWITKEHMPCATIKTSFRPVPLHWHHAYTAPPPRGMQLVDLLTKDGRALNPRLDSKSIAREEARAMIQRRQRQMSRSDDLFLDSSWDMSLAELMEVDPALLRKTMVKRMPGMEPLILRLRKQNMLPAIWFILSRKDCDLSAVRATTGSVLLTTETEQKAIKAEIDALQEDQPEAVREALVPALIRGVASHHAGHLPGWKALVEKLFQKGLLKIVFATGTLAAGINMPARTTVISALGRRTDDGIQPLPHNELLQMAGRAGRRGYDTEGNCVVLQTRWPLIRSLLGAKALLDEGTGDTWWEGPEEAWAIIDAGPEPLVSHFSVSYGLVLNLLSVYSLDQSRDFCRKSFGNYLRAVGNTRRQAEIARLEAKIASITEQFAATASVKAKELNDAVRQAKESLKAARLEAEKARMQVADDILTREGLPRKVVLSLLVDKKGSKGMRTFSLPAVLLRKVPTPPGSAEQCIYEGLGADNRLLRVSASYVVGWLSGAEGELPADAVQQVDTALQKAVGWSRLAARIDSVLVAPGSSATAMVALQLQPKVSWQTLSPDAVLAAKLIAAKEALRDALSAQEAHRRQEVNGQGSSEDEEGEEGVGAGRNGNGNGRQKRASKDKSSMDRMAQARSMQARVDKLREEVEQADEDTWRKFTEVVDILQMMGALSRGALALQPLGLVARNIQGQNELWLALVLTHPAMFGLTGPELAGVLGAILCGEVVRKPGQIQAAYTASQRVVDAVNAVEGPRQQLTELQATAGLSGWNDTLLLDLRLAGIVEAWAAGATWKQIVMDSGMDDGDIARLLIRTVDLLKQISWQRELLPHLQDACMEALKGMDRKPIAETLL